MEFHTETSDTAQGIRQICESSSSMLLSREAIHQFVESPLVRACEIFWDKGIQTLDSSANTEDDREFAYIFISYEHLSATNRNTLSLSIKQEYAEIISGVAKFSLPIKENTPVNEISEFFEGIAGKFRQQEASWVESFSIEDLKEHMVHSVRNAKMDDPNYWVEDGTYFYDPNSKLFYWSEEQFKLKESLKGKS